MFTLVAVSILIGFILIFLLSRSPSSIPAEKDFYREKSPGLKLLEEISLPQFERICIRFLEELGLVINSLTSDGEGQIDISAFNPQPIIGGEYLVHCYLAPKGQPVESTRIIALGDTVKAEGAAKGIFITTGSFSEEVSKLYEGPRIELINGQRLHQLLQEHGIHLPPS